MSDSQRFRWTAYLLVLGLIAAACSGSDEPASVTSTTIATEPKPVTLECERLSYPCSWVDADAAVLRATLELMGEVADLLEAGTSPQQVATGLLDEADVVSANWSEDGILLRVSGGLPVAVLTDAASPLEIAAGRSDAAQVVSPAPVAHVEPLGLASPRVGSAVLAQGSLESANYEPTGEPDVRPRAAMVLSPTRTANHAASVEANQTAGLPLPAAPPTATRDVLVASDHYTVLDLPDEQATPGHWANMSAFDLVIVETHGAFFGCTAEEVTAGDSCGVHLVGPLAEPYIEAIEAGGDVVTDYADYGGITFAESSIDNAIHLDFSADFFASVYGTGIGETILILNSCRMGLDDVSPRYLPSVFAGARGTVFSWQEAVPITSADAATARLVQFLLQGADAATAFEHLKEAIEYPIPYRAIRARMLLTSEANRRARDVAITWVDGTVAEPLVEILVDGAPDDGEDDRILDVEIRIDGVLPEDQDVTMLSIEVNGQALLDREGNRLDNGPVLSAETARGSTDSTEPWERHVVDLDGALLPFQLSRDDLLGREHTWRVEVSGVDGGPTVHEIPVLLRVSRVRVAGPSGVTLAPNQRVLLSGTPNDGEAERLPMTVKVDLGAENTDGYSLEVSIDGDMKSWSLAQLNQINPTTYVLNETWSLGDFTDTEREVTVKADLNRESDDRVATVADFEVDVTLLVKDVGRGTLTLNGKTWEFDIEQCYVDRGGEVDAAGHVEFNFIGEGTYVDGGTERRFVVDVSNRVRGTTLGTDERDEETNDSITLDIDNVDVAESTLFRLVPGDPVPEVESFPTRFLEFRDDYREVSATAYFWGDLINTDLSTLLTLVEVGRLQATCPTPGG